jgi:protein-tyrosine phosphatase
MDDGEYGNAGSLHVHAGRRGMSHPEDEMHTVDLHFHLLPGVDDGPAEMADSVELARQAAAQGTATVVATPHVRPDFFTDVPSLPDRLHEVRRALRAEGIALELLCGGELGHDMVGRLSQSELEAIAQGPPGARWLLVETPFEGVSEAFHAATDELRDRGFSVVMAHPERSADAALDDAQGLRRELRLGAVAQINAQSLDGRHGEDAERAGHSLLAEGLPAVIASDAHGPTRPPALNTAAAVLRRRGTPPGLARQLTGSGPRALLERGLLSAPPLAA